MYEYFKKMWRFSETNVSMFIKQSQKYNETEKIFTKKILEIDVIYDLFTIGRKAFVGFSH